MERESLTLAQLTALIKETIELTFEEPLWVVAEIHRVTLKDHVYLDLVEKAEGSDTIIAQMRAMVWRSYRRSVVDKFELMTDQAFGAGIKVLVKGYVSFHPRYGLALDIRDIDPYYTLGDLYRRKQEVIRQLKEEGIFDMNRGLELPLVIQRIAVISSETAAGFEDFVNHLEHNGYGLRFYYKLFPASVQGDQAEASIIRALDAVFRVHEEYDVVVIIRGGGSKADLGVFDTYNLAANVAQFPLPVLTGIGHTRDESVVDMVAKLSLKTPTAVADFIVERAVDFLGEIGLLYERLSRSVHYFLTDQRLRISQLNSMIREQVKSFLWKKRYELDQIHTSLVKVVRMPMEEKHKLTMLWQSLVYGQKRLIEQNRRVVEQTWERTGQALANLLLREQNRLERLRLKIEGNDPKRILKQGYSITLHNGKALKDIETVSPGDEIETVLYNGRLVSRVKAKKED